MFFFNTARIFTTNFLNDRIVLDSLKTKKIELWVWQKENEVKTSDKLRISMRIWRHWVWILAGQKLDPFSLQQTIIDTFEEEIRIIAPRKPKSYHVSVIWRESSRWRLGPKVTVSITKR